MSKNLRYAVSVLDLDRLNLCPVYMTVAKPWCDGEPQTAIRERLLRLTGGSEAKVFTLKQVLSSGALEFDSRVLPVRHTLTALARLAQSDEELRGRLTGFINDCAIAALPSFEKDWSSDGRPRRAISATQELLSGRLERSDWVQIAREGLIAWAGWFAPMGLYASAEWAAWDNRSWLVVSERSGRLDERLRPFAEWQDWAEWAAFNILIFLGKDYHEREKPDGLDELNHELHLWATNRLADWLEAEAPEPLPLPESPLKRGPQEQETRCTARFVKEFPDMDWPMMAIFPEGLEEIGAITLDRNAVLSVPDGVTSIGSIYLSDHPTLELPSSLREIGSIDATYDSVLEIPEGVQRIEKIRLYLESSVSLPSTIEWVGTIDAEAESFIEDVGLDDYESEEDYWFHMAELEKPNAAFPDVSFVACKNRNLIKRREKVRFIRGEPQID